MKKKLFDPWPKNVQTYSWWKLGVLSTPYDLQKKTLRIFVTGWGEGTSLPDRNDAIAFFS